jgi:hypothetical protein
MENGKLEQHEVKKSRASISDANPKDFPQNILTPSDTTNGKQNSSTSRLAHLPVPRGFCRGLINESWLISYR